MITVRKHFLPVTLIDEVMSYVKENINSYEWSTNLGWDKTIVEQGGQVSVFSLNIFKDSIKKEYVKINDDYQYLNPKVSFYVWQRGSHIPWHNDTSHTIGSTIYLNEYWDINNGGLFLWKDTKDNCIKAEVPEFNKMVLNGNNIAHAVSMISTSSPDLRLSMQVWLDK